MKMVKQRACRVSEGDKRCTDEQEDAVDQSACAVSRDTRRAYAPRISALCQPYVSVFELCSFAASCDCQRG